MENSLIKYFWACGDNQIIEFAIMRARLNRHEREAITLLLDDCRTQEQAAEIMDISPRRLQSYWYSACNKLLAIDWLRAYANELKNKSQV